MAVNAELTWVKDLQFVGRPENGSAVVLDSHDGGSGNTPMELLLLGIGGCTGMDVISVMEKKRQKVSEFSVKIKGEQAEGYPQKYTAVHIEYIFYGQNIDPRAVERSIELSTTKYCSAIASINARLTTSYTIFEAE